MFAANDSIWTASPARALSTAAATVLLVELDALGDDVVADPDGALVHAHEGPLLDGGQHVRADVVDRAGSPPGR